MVARLRDHLVSVEDGGSHGLYGDNVRVSGIADRYLTSGVLPAKQQATGFF